MSSYVCAELDQLGSCLQWVQTWTPAALSIDDAAKLSAGIVLCWVTAYGLRTLVRFVINRL